MTEDRNPKAARAIADGKPPLQFIDSAMTHPAARVLASGAEKYGVRNWREVPINASTYIGALRRHTDEWADGSDVDGDSGEHPLAHVVATCNVVLDAIKYGMLVDDRLFADANTASFEPCPICALPANCKDGGRCLTRARWARHTGACSDCIVAGDGISTCSGRCR